MLPREGGLLDQDARMVTGMVMVLAAEVEKSEREAEKKTNSDLFKWSELPEEEKEKNRSFFA